MKKRTLTILIAVVLVVACEIGGTLAWLTAQSGVVTNTFTAGDINITLNETTGNTYKMIPGNKIAKDPKVTVAAGSEDCWLFVKVNTENNVDAYLKYAIAAGWNQLKDNDNNDISGVYYREVTANATVREFSVLGEGSYVVDGTSWTWSDNEVLVKPQVTKAQLTSLNTTNYPVLKFKAFAVQQDNIQTALAAWNTIPDKEKSF